MPTANALKLRYSSQMSAKKKLLSRFLARESSSGVVVLFGAALGLFVANTPLSGSYKELFEHQFRLSLSSLTFSSTVHHFINDFLMVIFFYVVGLEIKRELVSGHLNSAKKALMPFIAALGGMAVPALIYLAIAGRTDATGWGVPVATDIALAVGLLTIIAKGAPQSLRAFLLALAVIDDIGAILIIALVYSAGIHPTLIGVALGLLTPQYLAKKSKPFANRIEEALHPISSFLVVPIFAFANTGITINSKSVELALASSIAWGIFFGLVVGKPLGIVTAALGAKKLKIADLPSGLKRKVLGATGSAAGIGFTVSIFIAQLAFEETQLQEIAILAVIAASVVSAGISALLFKVSLKK